MSYNHILIEQIERTVPLTEAERIAILAAFRPRELKKKEMLLFRGDISRHMRFVATGCLRAYYIDDGAQEHILHFGIEGWWVNDLYSYLTGTPAEYFIQAIEPSTVLQVQRSRLEQLFKEAPVMERFFRIKMQSAYVALQERTIKAMSQTAEERYTRFREKYREIEQRVPQYMVAAYLGITPEHLSTIRKKISS